MSNRVPFNAKDSSLGQQVAEYLDLIAQVRARGPRIMGILACCVTNTTPPFTPDYTGIESEIGGMEPGGGEAMYNLLADANNALTAAGGAATSILNQLSRLDQG